MEAKAEIEDCVHHAFMAKVTEVETDHSASSTASCVNCADLNSKIVKLRSHNLDLITELTNLKEAYDVLNKSEKEFKDTISQLKDDNHELKITVVRKQDAINAYLDEINLLKKELSKEKLETELVKRKLESYLNSAYVLDHIVSVKPTRGEGVGYNKCPPPMHNNFSMTPEVEKSLDIEVKNLLWLNRRM